MNRQQFYQYLQNPEILDEESLKNLNELVLEYPYFQTGRMLLAKNLALTSHIKYNMELKKAAAHIPDRRQLYFLINPPIPNQPKIAAAVEPTVTVDEPIITIDSPVIEAVEVNIVEPAPTVELSTPPIVNEPDELAEIAVPMPEITDNYFDVSDIIDLDNGTSIDFSQSQKPKETIEPDLLPTADLLDYELAGKSAYQLGNTTEEPFDPNKIQPFSAWLKVMSHPVAPLPTSAAQEAPINKQMQIIESFLQKGRDRIVPDKTAIGVENTDISELSVQDSDALMTETLANIHIKQKQYQKALVIFEKLSLKYPEKSIYFAARIKDIESLITNP